MVLGLQRLMQMLMLTAQVQVQPELQLRYLQLVPVGIEVLLFDLLSRLLVHQIRRVLKSQSAG